MVNNFQTSEHFIIKIYSIGNDTETHIWVIQITAATQNTLQILCNLYKIFVEKRHDGRSKYNNIDEYPTYSSPSGQRPVVSSYLEQ